jgi:hypothetical protein
MNAPAQPLVPLTRDERLRPWGPRIHVATGTATFFGIPIWNSTAVIELEQPGELLVWNPIALTDTLRESLGELERSTGRRVTKLLNPCDYHHASLGDWQRAFPDAETFLVSERIRDQRPALRGRVVEGDRPVIPGCEADVGLLSARGYVQPWIERSPKWANGPRREWFVFHAPSRSLLIGDLLHLNAEVGWAERLVGFRVPFTLNAAGFRVADRAERDAFLRDVLAWDFDQAITVHGKVTAHGAPFLRDQLSKALGLS